MSSITRLLTAVDLTDRELDEDVSRFGKCSGRVDDKKSGRASDAVFFPDDRQITTDEAREACSGCPVIAECLELALRIEAQPGRLAEGIYGGKTPEERNNLRRGMRRRAHAARVRDERLAVA